MRNPKKRQRTPSTEPETDYRRLCDKMEEGFFSAQIVRDSVGNIVDWQILEANTAIQRNTGYQSSDLIGRAGSEVFPAEREWWLRLVRQVIESQHSEHIQQFFNGGERWFETIVFPFGRDRFAVLYHDITERRRRESRATVLDCVTSELAELSDPSVIMERVGEMLGDYLKLSSCSFVEVDDARGELTVRYNWQVDGTPSLVRTFKMREYYSEDYIRERRSGRTTVVDNTATDGRVDAEGYALLKIGALVSVPFMWQGRWIACICAASATPRRWQEEEVALIQEISSRVFSRIEKARAEEKLRMSEERYRTLFESVEEGYCIIRVIFDKQGEPVDWEYLDANPTFQRQAGFNPLGKRISQAIPDVEQRWLEFYAGVVRTRVPAKTENYVTSIDRWFSVAAAPVGDSGDVLAVVFDDISVRKRVERSLQESERIKSFLLRLSDALRPLSDASDIHEMVTAISLDYFDADRCYYCEVIDEHNVVRRDAAREGLPSVAGAYPLAKMPVFSAVLRAGEPFVVADIASSELVDEWLRKVWMNFLIRSFLCVPVVKKGELKGLLCVAQNEPRAWTKLELGLAEDIAFRTWAAVERATAEQRLERELHDMRRLQQISNRLIEEDNIQPLYDAIMESAMEIMGADGANIQCFIPERNELYMLAHKNIHPIAVREWQCIERDLKSKYWSAVVSGGRVIIADVENCPFDITKEDLEYCRLSGLAAVQNTPLINRAGNHVGILSTHWSRPHMPSERDLSLLDVLARQTADLIDQRRVQEALRETRTQLDKLLQQ